MKRKRDNLEVFEIAAFVTTTKSLHCQAPSSKQCYPCQHRLFPALLQHPVLFSFPSAIVGLIVEFTHDELQGWMYAQFAPSQVKFLERISSIQRLANTEKRKRLSAFTRDHYTWILHLCETLISQRFHALPIPVTTTLSFSQQELHEFFHVLQETLEILDLTLLSQTHRRKITNTLVEREFILKAHLTPVDELSAVINNNCLETLGKSQRDHLTRYCTSLLKKKTTMQAKDK
jgi:hypothetical protein